MERHAYNPIAGISDTPTAWEYFWHQLPFALPGFFTFGIAVFLSVVCLQAYFFRNRKAEYWIFTGVFISFGYLALVLSFRSIVLSREILLQIHNTTYWLVLLSSPVSYLAYYYIVLKKYRSLFYYSLVSVAIVLWGTYSLLTHTAFTGDWIVYVFGQYPVGGLALKIWGGYSGLGYIFLAVPYYIKLSKEEKDQVNKPLFYGFNLLIILLLSNLPSLSGIAIYPLGVFFFIPMLMMAYGIFRSDFLDIRTLVLEKRAGFYLAAFFIVGVLATIAFFVAMLLNPDHHEGNLYNLYALIPLFSLFCLLSLASYIAGTNPTHKLNLYTAGIMAVSSFLQIIGIFRTMDIDPFVSYRIEQVFYLFFVLTPALNTRLLFTVFEKRFDFRVYVIDAFAVLTAFLTQTPYLFSGYFIYDFGRIPKSGPVLVFYILLGLFSLSIVIVEWFRLPPDKKQGFRKWIFYSVTLGNILIFLNIPAVLGYPIYPIGNFQFIAVLIMAYSVIQFNSLDVKGQAQRITWRYTFFIFVLVSILILLIAAQLEWTKVWTEYLIFLTILWVFLFLTNYISSFVVIRPLASVLDKNYQDLVESTNQANNTKNLLQTSFRELETINQLQEKINFSTDIDAIFQEVSEYFRKVFSVQDTWLVLSDSQNQYLFTAAINLKDEASYTQESIQWTRNFRVPISPEIGSLYRTFVRKKYFYFPRVEPRKSTPETDRLIAKHQNLRSVIQYPLVANDTCIGVFCINLGENKKLSKNEMDRMESFFLLIAGAIQRASLFREAYIAKQEFQKIGEEIHAINGLNNAIIEINDIDRVMEHVLKYLHERFGLEAYYALYTIDDEGKYASLLKAKFPITVEDLDMQIMYKTRIALQSNQNFHSKVYHTRKGIYLRNIREEMGDSFETWVIKTAKLKNYLSLPLLIGDQVIGILDLSDVHGNTWKINKKIKTDLENLGHQISSALDKNLKYKDILSSKLESEKNVENLRILNSLSTDFNSDLDLTRILQKLEEYLHKQFNVRQYGIAIVDRSKSFAKIYFTNLHSLLSDSKRQMLQDWKIDMTDPKGGHAYAFKTKKALFLKRLNYSKISPSEIEVISGLKIQSLFIIPLIVRNEVIGLLDFYDKNPLELTKKQREYLVEFSNLIASAVYNSILVQDLQNAYEDLKNSQNQLIQSEKMAALGQLISGVAHEINTPLGAIKASVGNIQNSLNETIEYLPKFLKEISETDWNTIQAYIEKSRFQSGLMNSREMRKMKKELTAVLEQNSVDSAVDIADGLVDVGITELNENEIHLWKNPNRLEILRTIYNISGFLQKSRIIQDAVNRASKIVYALKNYAHFSSPDIMQKARIKDGLETVLTIYQNSIKKGVEVETNFQDLTEIYCFADELNQVWTNMIHNALQAMEYQGHLKLSVVSDLGDIVVSIEDSGPGIPPDIQEKIFRPFFTTKGRGEGSGLGLHISRRIVEKHGGSIQLKSQPGSTVFSIRIPARTVPLAAETSHGS